MAFKDRLKERRENLNYSREELANMLNITASAVGNYETGVSFPKVDLLYKIFNCLDISPNFLFQDECKNQYNKFSTKELDILHKYNNLDKFGKNIIDSVLNIEFERCLNISNADNLEEEKGSLSFMKIIPLADVALSAGEGIEPITDTTEGIEIDSRDYPQADIAFKVKGDSMEPRYSDGDIVYVHSQPTLDNGQIGAFLFNGEQYLKKYIIEDGKYILRSLNNKYKDIVISENDSFDVYGKVLN